MSTRAEGKAQHPVPGLFDLSFRDWRPVFVRACKGFLAEVANPTLEEILKGMSGNLCRCGTYAGIQKAVAQAASSTGTKLRRIAKKRVSAKAKARLT